MNPLHLLSLALLAVFVSGHPGEVHEPLSEREIALREAAAEKRYVQARNCAAQIDAFTARRVAKRELDARATVTATAANPSYTVLQNTTCVLAPETVEGPYYINNEFVRQDLRESQTGVKLVLDIGVMDTRTCTPLPAAFVELWAANATGVYGGYSAGGAGGGGPPGGGGGGAAVSRNETFLRGGLATDANGMTEIVTIYPGFYAGRTAHIHAMVHMNYTLNANSTLVSHAGNLLHIGQFFFEETWNDQVYAVSPYTTNTQQRTLNSADGILNEANTGGYSAFVSLKLIGSTLSSGLLGYITVGVDSTASYAIANTNYLTASAV